MPIHVRSETIAPVVFLPGDPNRAQWIANTFLENVKCTTTYRQMLGFTGEYTGIPVSVQTTGMGGPSAAIVCEELAMLGAKFFIRVGTCGAIREDINPGDLLLVTGACMSDGTSQEIVRNQMTGTNLHLGFPATSDFEYIMAAKEEAVRAGIPHHLGKVASLDRFYGHPDETYHRMANLGICAVEMEAATVLTQAALHQIRAACMMTVSDLVFGAKRAPESVIAQGVENMIRVALNGYKNLIQR